MANDAVHHSHPAGIDCHDLLSLECADRTATDGPQRKPDLARADARAAALESNRHTGAAAATATGRARRGPASRCRSQRQGGRTGAQAIRGRPNRFLGSARRRAHCIECRIAALAKPHRCRNLIGCRVQSLGRRLAHRRTEMKIYSWNVNGIRAVHKKGLFLSFIDAHKPDILCLQETKAERGQIEIELPNYREYWNSAVKKGYSGTAIFNLAAFGLGLLQTQDIG